MEKAARMYEIPLLVEVICAFFIDGVIYDHASFMLYGFLDTTTDSFSHLTESFVFLQ
jgi:hypothetical protein